MNDIDDIIEDLFKIYMSCLDSYNSKIYQVVNDKYTVIDRSMIAVYLYIKILEDRNEKSKEITEVLENYLLKQIIYSETGNLAIEISDKDKVSVYNEILDKLILEKFNYKNRIMKKLKYSYKDIQVNDYKELLIFLESIADYAIFQKMVIRGNNEAVLYFEKSKEKIIEYSKNINDKEYFYNEKKDIINLILNNKFSESGYGNLTSVVLNLRDVYRYSIITTQLPENVLLHQYMVFIMSVMIAEYCNKELGENIDIYTIMIKSLFHDFSEYKGTEIVTQFKNYNDVTKKMFKEIEDNDEKELIDKIGYNLYSIISQYKCGAEGFISEVVDKILGIKKLWVEVGYFNNYNFIKTTNSIYQDRFKRFLRVENINEIKNKSFYLELLRKYYIYVKEHLVESNIEYFLKYYTTQELEEFRNEIKLLKTNPETFLR